MKNHISKLDEEVRMMKGLLSHFLNLGHAQMAVSSNQQQQQQQQPYTNNNHGPTMPLNAIADRNVLRPNSTLNLTSVSPSDNQKRQQANFPLKYGTIHSDSGGDVADPMQLMQQQFNELLKDDHANFNRCNNNTNNTNSNSNNNLATVQPQFPSDIDVYANAPTENHECTIVQMEKDNIELRRELQDARASNKQADKKIQE